MLKDYNLELGVIDKNPESISIVTYIFVLGLSAWGGIVNYLRRKKYDGTTSFLLAELVGEMVISSFAGMIVFFLCQISDINPFMQAALIAMAGHAGSRIIFQLEGKILDKVLPSSAVKIKE